MNHLPKRLAAKLPVLVLSGIAFACGVAAAQPEWLSLCSKCLNPSVVSKSGIGTAKAAAVAKVTRADAADWCDNWQPDDKTCLEGQAEEIGKTYRAEANCVAGKLTAIDGKRYSLAGKWTSDVGKGRTRWRDAATGEIVGQDNASGGLSLAQQWETLCPAAVK